MEGVKEEAEGEAQEGGPEGRAWQAGYCRRRHGGESFDSSVVLGVG